MSKESLSRTGCFETCKNHFKAKINKITRSETAVNLHHGIENPFAKHHVLSSIVINID